MIRWSKWPTALSASDDVSDYEHLDDIIISLATSWGFRSVGDKERMYLWGNFAWDQLKQAIFADDQSVDREITPISEIKTLTGDYWKDPFIRRMG